MIVYNIMRTSKEICRKPNVSAHLISKTRWDAASGIINNVVTVKINGNRSRQRIKHVNKCEQGLKI